MEQSSPGPLLLAQTDQQLTTLMNPYARECLSLAQTCCSETFVLMSALEGESDLVRGGLEGRV